MRWLAWLAVACAPAVPVPPGASPDLRPPRITEAQLTCDARTATWTLAVRSDAWSGGGTSAWTTDGRYVEVHPVRSVAAAGDGSSDELLLVLPVVSDWRDAAPGRGTDFGCAADPDVVFWLFDTAGDPTDCWSRGPHPEVWRGVDGVDACP